uniref:EOG090X00E0 n=1 Tax=Daphnia dolichocephala TaxID=2282166 RepID=A0A4Y7M313_9CRUS|nr:EOG090X00E0 [Daphnia dolichocephala]
MANLKLLKIFCTSSIIKAWFGKRQIEIKLLKKIQLENALRKNDFICRMGMFFSPGLPAINIFKLFLLLYIRSWAVLTCNVPHEVIFKASRSNNFYLWLLLIMLFLCTLPVAYAIVWLEPSWHCGPFSEYSRIFHVMTQSLLKATPDSLHWILSYIASPGVVIPLLVLLILVIYYLVSLSSSLREAVTDLRTQLRRERDAERLKTRQKKAEQVAQTTTDPPASDAAAAKIIAQWRKAVPFVPTTTQTTLPQALAKEAVDKRQGGGSMHQRAGPVIQVSPPVQPTVVGRNGDRREQPAKTRSAGHKALPAGARAEAIGDGSDLDISDSLPQDSPVLSAPAGPSVQQTASPPHQPVYASVVKKKKEPISSPPRVGAKPNRTTIPKSGTMTEAPRSPARIPLIRISQTESVEHAEKNPTTTPMTDNSSAQDATTRVTGLVATSPTKSQQGGALNLILQRAKEKRAKQSVAVSESTADLVLNMEETATENQLIDDQKMEAVDDTLHSISDETPTVTEDQQHVSVDYLNHSVVRANETVSEELRNCTWLIDDLFTYRVKVMGKLKTRIKGPGNKGKRWAKGQSSSSNPTIKKHREVAKTRFFQPLLFGPPTGSIQKSGLTEEALKQHTYASESSKPGDPTAAVEVITSPPSVCQGDFGDDDTYSIMSGRTFRSSSSVKTFATGFSNCSNVSFSKLHRGFTPTSALHREMLAVLAAVSEVIKQQGGKETDTEYFAVLMTTLEVAETNEDSLGATLALLGMVIKRVPTNVLKAKFSTSAKSLLDLLGRYIESDNSLLVRSLIGCLGVLLRNQDVSAWSNSSTLQIYDALLTFVANPKPQVRKAAQHAICSVLKGSTFLVQDEDAPILHPVAARTGKYCLTFIEEHGFGNEPSPLLHLLNLLRGIMGVLPQSEVKPLCESLLKLMTLNNVLVSSCAMQCFHSMFICRPRTVTLSADLNARLITALYDYQPSPNDTQPLRGWLSVMTQALLNLGRLDLLLCAGHLPRFFGVATVLWSSDRMEVVMSVTPSLASLISQCLEPAFNQLENVAAVTMAAEKITRSVEQSLGYQTVKAWKYVIHLCTTLIEGVGKSRPELVKNLIKSLASMRVSPRFPHEAEVDFAIGKAIRICGPRFLLKCIPLGITGREKDAYDFPHSWLLPILRENIQNTELGFFIEYFLPLAQTCRSRVPQCKDDQDRVGFRVFDLLQRQMWALLPGFCKCPTDVDVSLKQIAKLLGQALTDRPDIRMDIMAALRQLIIHSKTDEKIRVEISRYAKNFIPLLFNLFTTKATTDEEESQRESVFQTITFYLQVADDELRHSLFDKAKERMTTSSANLKSEDKAVAEENLFMWESLLALLRTLAVYQDADRVESFVQLCLPWIMGTEFKPQKKAYRIVEEIVGADEASQCGRHVRASLDRIVKLFTSSRDNVKPPSKASRLRTLSRLVALLAEQPPTVPNRRFLTASAAEAALAIKGIGEKVKGAAFALLIDVGRVFQKWSPDPQVALKDYITKLMKGMDSDDDAHVSSAVTSVTYVVHEFASNCTEGLIDTILERICALLVTDKRDVVLACLVFIRMFTVTVHSQRLPLYVKRLIGSLSAMDDELKRIYLIRTRDVFIRLIRKCGADLVIKLVPEDDVVLLKRLNNIRKIEARKKKQKEERKAAGNEEEDDEEETEMATQPKTMEHVLADSDSDLEDDEDDKDVRKKTPKTWIQEEEGSIVDFLDPAAAKKVSATNPNRSMPAQFDAEKKKKKESFFKTAADGRMIIDDGGESSDTSQESDLDLSKALDKMEVDRKRKKDDRESLIDDEDEPSFKYQAGGSGIHRPVAIAAKPSAAKRTIQKLTAKQRARQSKEKVKPVDYGAEFRSAKARGDVKRKNQPDPFAYVPLSRNALNKRKKAKMTGQFKGLVHAARKGASTGTKIRVIDYHMESIHFEVVGQFFYGLLNHSL